ncbi:acetate--CoA ligase family protein [Arthrobacter sp. STN4]|uniref:acetate--CoA ligase family protein n=1 Tax=Arthrobacter sp. STN4 TaxID=2923276 RepID=UPI002119BB56|nr:acetate--CoA ligase family protein [Arthrobacter sp. STN4]MCQ9163743.1 acetate--CoA ligase family protein [Arthrobacter sp. STN4]
MTNTLPCTTAQQEAAEQGGNLSTLLRPRGIAIIGASRRVGSPAFRTLTNLVSSDFEGKIWPVNPKESELLELQCFASVRDIPGPVDLALVMVSAGQVESVIEECGMKSVPAVVVFSSGFAELGEDGRSMQEGVAATARRWGIRLVGPNSQGFAFVPSNLTATFSVPAANLGKPSGIAYIGQSGALGGALVYECRSRGIGLSAWMSTGNQADMAVTEIALAMLEEPEISILAIYLEELPEGQGWARVLKAAAASGKQIVVLRSGRTDAGKKAASSHTGAMIGSDAAFMLLSESLGAISVHDLDEMVDVFDALLNQGAGAGDRIGIVTSSGGAGSILVDHLHENSLRLADLSTDTAASLAQIVPAFGSVANPVDVTTALFTGDGGEFATVCRLVVDDPGVDHLVVLLTGLNAPRSARIADELAQVAAASQTPISFVHMAAPDGRAAVDNILHAARVGVYNSTRDAAVALGRVGRRRQTAVAASLQADEDELRAVAQLPEGGTVTEWEGRAFLRELGISVPDAVLLRGDDDDVAAIECLGEGPFALKAQSPQIVHKTEVGGVEVGVAPSDVPAAAERMRRKVAALAPGATVDGIMIQQMAGRGVELIIGLEGSDQGYPPVLTVGFGGSRAEIYADVVSALCPLDVNQARRLLESLTGWPLLDGYRGSERCDVATVVDTVVRLSRLASALGHKLADLEINPYIVHQRGATAVDLVLRLR